MEAQEAARIKKNLSARGFNPAKPKGSAVTKDKAPRRKPSKRKED